MAYQSITLTIADRTPITPITLTVTPATALYNFGAEVLIQDSASTISDLDYYGLLKVSRRVGTTAPYKFITYYVGRHYGAGLGFFQQNKNASSNTWTLWYKPNQVAVGRSILFSLGIDF